MSVRYITVTPLTNLFKPVERAYGDVAIVGAVDADATGPKKRPIPITNPDSVSDTSHPAGADRAVDSADWFKGSLGQSVRLALSQGPGTSKVYAVATDAGDGADALTNALAEVAKIPAQIVVLANTALSAVGDRPPLEALASHVNSVSTTGGDGKERIGVAMLGKGVTDTGLISGALGINRMILVAHRSDQDAAAAVAGAIGGHEPHISMLLKPIAISQDGEFSDAEIDAFNTARVNWLTDPLLLPGKGIHLGEGYTMGSTQPYIDIVRTIDDISFKLKARLIQVIGELRISRSGLRALESLMAGELAPLVQRGVIEGFNIFTPVLALLDKDPSSLTAAELIQIQNAQNDRVVTTLATVDYAGAIHRLNISLKFD